MDPAILIAAITGLTQVTKLIQSLVTTAQQKGELTPEAEAAWKANLDLYRQSPAGQPTDAGKL